MFIILMQQCQPNGNLAGADNQFDIIIFHCMSIAIPSFCLR